jgi:hypothetical protein
MTISLECKLVFTYELTWCKRNAFSYLVFQCISKLSLHAHVFRMQTCFHIWTYAVQEERVRLPRLQCLSKHSIHGHLFRMTTCFSYMNLNMDLFAHLFRMHVYVCVYVCMYVWMNVCMYVCMDLFSHLFGMHMYVCMYVCMNEWMYVCMYVWTCFHITHELTWCKRNAFCYLENWIGVHPGVFVVLAV